MPVADTLTLIHYESVATPHSIVPVLSPPVRIPNPVTPLLFSNEATVMIEPNSPCTFAEPVPQGATELAMPIISAESVTTPPIARKGPSRSRMLLTLSLVVLLLIVSTGVFFTVFAHRGTTGSTRSVTTKTSPITKASSIVTLTDATVAQDTFQRNDQTFWGNASDGQQWREEASQKSFFSIKNKTGQVVATENGAFNALLGPLRNNEDIVFTGSVSHFAQNVNIGAVVRWTDEGDWYKALIDGNNLLLIKHVHGVSTQIGSVAFPAQDNVAYSLHLRIVGTTLLASVWQSDQQEPKSWMLTAQDNSFATIKGSGGLRFSVQVGTVVTITSSRATQAHSAD